jgi:hypothetical protein
MSALKITQVERCKNYATLYLCRTVLLSIQLKPPTKAHQYRSLGYIKLRLFLG